MIRTWLPQRLRAPLWGDRERHGLVIRSDDPCWVEWRRTSLAFYEANQRAGIGTRINDAGYRVMSRVDLAGARVLEIGAGDIRHIPFWRGRPAEYLLADVDAAMLAKARTRLEEAGVAHRAFEVQRGGGLALADGSVDVVVSFYSLEHLYPLAPYVRELHRVLRPGGVLVGAIPAEGGLAWGLGRLVTSRRWLKRHTTIDPDKIICWEHPNYADAVLGALGAEFEREHLSLWPLPWLPLHDLNLIIRLVYRRRSR
jgi:SAM-dependent methyltransferase